MYDILELKSKLLPALQEIAKNLNIKKHKSLKKMDLIYQILDTQAINPKISENKKEINTVEKDSVIQVSKPNNNSKKIMKTNNQYSNAKKIAKENSINKPKERPLRPRRKNETQLDRIKKAENKTLQNKLHN